MSLPPLIPVPPASIRLSIAPEEWEACLDSWVDLGSLYLRLPPARFKTTVTEEEGHLVDFLKSYYHEAANRSSDDTTLRGSPRAQQLLRLSFKLLHRTCLEAAFYDPILDWILLSDVCHVHVKSNAIPGFMAYLWKLQRPGLEKMLQRAKESLSKALEASISAEVADGLHRLVALMHSSTDVAVFFMAGSDFLDALVSAHRKAGTLDQRRAIISTVYLGLLSVVRTDPPNVSLLTDHLYSLKAYGDQSSPASALLADLVTNTPIVTAMRRTLSDRLPERSDKLLDTILTYRQASLEQPRKRIQRRKNKGKGRSAQHGELNMHRMSLVSQIQDLFPDLGSGFVLRLLDEYGDDVEQVTAHLLDDALPSHIRELDHAEQSPLSFTAQETHLNDLAPRSTPPPSTEQYIPERRNVFDDDELDDIDFHTGRLHIGKKEARPSDGHANKAAILSALAAFDSDDDERDDTYDVDDVGGTIDAAHPDGEPGSQARVSTAAAQDDLDAALFPAYQSHPQLFGRSFDVRRGQPRLALRRDTGLTDEAIEGWALMLQRDPQRLRRLQARNAAFDGSQTALASTAYRAAAGTESEGDSDGPRPPMGGRGGFPGRGRGRGRGGGGRGGSVAGPASEAGTAKAQRHKEANKSSRANHNRRDQRAKKMARGGFSG